MARYYRRRYRTIVRAPKKKWCSNIKNVSFNKQNTGSSAGNIVDQMVLAHNSTEINTPTPIIVKTGNFKLQADFHVYYSTTITDFATQAYARLFIIYIPEGVMPSSPTYLNMSPIITSHPEWILAWKYFDVTQGAISPNTVADGTKISMSSRLKRNLNTGDSIYAVFLMDSLPAGATVTVRGMCQFWTCAN